MQIIKLNSIVKMFDELFDDPNEIIAQAMGDDYTGPSVQYKSAKSYNKASLA